MSKANVRKSARTVSEAAMAVAFIWAESRSKDPSTKVGAVVVDPKTGSLHLGYNGFPSGIYDLDDLWQRREDKGNLKVVPCRECDGDGEITVEARHGSDWQETCPKCKGKKTEPAASRFQLTKYDLVVHAEQNAVRKALAAGCDLTKATLVCTLIPCPRCMLTEVVASGIRTVVFAEDKYHAQTDRDAWLTREVARLGGVRLVHVDRAGKVLDER